MIPGVTVNVRTFGDGPQVALSLHPSLAHGGAFRALAAQMPGWRLVAPDLPGHGESADWDGTRDLHDVATEAAAAVLDGIGPCCVIGHSFGATVALRLALEQPARVRRLVLAEPVLFAAVAGPVHAAHLAEHAGFAAAMGAGDLVAAAAAFQAIWGAGVPFGDLPVAQRGYIADRMPLIPAQNATLYDDAAGLLAPGRLEGLRMPVLLVEGAMSPPVIAAIHAVLAARLPVARRVVIAGAGHMAPITHPADVAAAIRG